MCSGCCIFTKALQWLLTRIQLSMYGKNGNRFPVKKLAIAFPAVHGYKYKILFRDQQQVESELHLLRVTLSPLISCV